MPMGIRKRGNGRSEENSSSRSVFGPNRPRGFRRRRALLWWITKVRSRRFAIGTNGWSQDQLQLGAYADLIERGLTQLPPGEVEAAVYFVSKAESRNKGFYQKENSGALV